MIKAIIKASAQAQEERRTGTVQSQQRRISRAIEEAFGSAVSSLNTDEIERLIRTGGTLALEQYLVDQVRQHLAPAAEAVTGSLVAGGRLSASFQGDDAGLPLRFDVGGDVAVEFIRSGSRLLEEQVADQVRRMVQQIVPDGIRRGLVPGVIAQQVKQSVGLSARDAQAVINYRRGLEQSDRTVLDRALRDRRFDRSVRRAISGQVQVPSDQVERMVSTYRDRLINFRRNATAGLYALRSVHEGNVAFWEDAVSRGIVRIEAIRRFWVFIHDERVRNAHIRIPGLNPEGVGLREAFQSPLGPLRYPGDPAGRAANIFGCRCTEYTEIRRF